MRTKWARLPSRIPVPWPPPFWILPHTGRACRGSRAVARTRSWRCGRRERDACRRYRPPRGRRRIRGAAPELHPRASSRAVPRRRASYELEAHCPARTTVASYRRPPMDAFAAMMVNPAEPFGQHVPAGVTVVAARTPPSRFRRGANCHRAAFFHTAWDGPSLPRYRRRTTLAPSRDRQVGSPFATSPPPPDWTTGVIHRNDAHEGENTHGTEHRTGLCRHGQRSAARDRQLGRARRASGR